MNTEAKESLVLSELLPAADGKHNIGRITLNSPRTLNSLNLEIMLSLREILGTWENDARVAAVFIDSTSEKALCAGGDVKRVHQYIVTAKASGQDPMALAQVFFENEYRLDYYIHSYKKPIIVWGDGIVMGGGIGIMAGASHRVVTEATMLAMPEVTIGLYPDVSASYFLPRMPGKIGLFLGLTAARMNAGDALFVGLADHYIPRGAKADLLLALRALTLTSKSAAEAVSHCLTQVGVRASAAALPHPPASILQKRQTEIDSLMSGSDVETIADRFAKHSVAADDKFLMAAREAMLKGSPTSLKITFEQYRRSQGIRLNDAFRQELCLSVQCCLHTDFVEGVRALLVDKDSAPQWSPDSLKDVTKELVLKHFQAPWSGTHPLADL